MAHSLTSEAKPCPWFVQEITWSKTSSTSVETILIKKVSSWNMSMNTTFSTRQEFSICNFRVNTKSSIVSSAPYWPRCGQYLCYHHLLLASSPCEQFNGSLHSMGEISSDFMQYDDCFKKQFCIQILHSFHLQNPTIISYAWKHNCNKYNKKLPHKVSRVYCYWPSSNFFFNNNAI